MVVIFITKLLINKALTWLFAAFLQYKYKLNVLKCIKIKHLKIGIVFFNIKIVCQKFLCEISYLQNKFLILQVNMCKKIIL